MLPSLNGSTTYAAAPGGGPCNQHLTHVPQRQRRQAGLHVLHRPTPAPLHSMQERRRCRPTPLRARQVLSRLGTCLNVSAARRVCTCRIDPHQLHCNVCKSGVGVDQRHSALARCLADLVTTHTGAKAHIEQTIPGNSGRVFDQHGTTTFIDVAIVTLFSSSPGLISAASARPGFMAKSAEKIKFDRYLVFGAESTQGVRLPPASGCVRGLTPTSCAARKGRWSPGRGNTG